MKIAEIKELIVKAPTIKGMKTKLVSVDGCGGAGKSTFAEKLSRVLNNCPVIHTDDFATPEEPLSWYLRMLQQVLLPFEKNRPACFQKYNWNKKT